MIVFLISREIFLKILNFIETNLKILFKNPLYINCHWIFMTCFSILIFIALLKSLFEKQSRPKSIPCTFEKSVIRCHFNLLKKFSFFRKSLPLEPYKYHFKIMGWIVQYLPVLASGWISHCFPWSILVQ